MSGDALGPFGTQPEDDDVRDVSDDAPFDFTGADMFTQEIENVNASDWDMDSDLLWGDDGAQTTVDIADSAFDSDFPI